MSALLAPAWAGAAVADSEDCRPLTACLILPAGAQVGQGADERGRFLRVRLSSAPANPFAAQLLVPTRLAVRAGDTLVARLWARSPTPGAEVELVFEEAGGGYRKSVVYPLALDAEWRLLEVPFRAAADHSARGARAAVRLGLRAQELELGRLIVEGAGSRGPETLPRAPVSYEGREAGAAWRAQAEERIERLRRASLKVRVVDEAGQPVSGARVKLDLRRHEFLFGAAVNERFLESGRGEDLRRYRETVEDLFNGATLENAAKWNNWERGGSRQASAAASWLKGKGLRVRGHPLIWPSSGRVPPEVAALKGRPKELEAAVLRRVAEATGRLRGSVDEWDVVNEPCADADLLAPGAVERWLRAARAADPGARLYLNDFGVLETSEELSAQAECYLGLSRSVRAADAPLDGLGLQAHFGWRLTPPARVVARLDRFGSLPLIVSEVSIPVYDRALQADYLRDLMIAAFSHPAVEGFVLWGFWEGVHGDEEALFARDWTPSPAASAWVGLVHGRWASHERLATDADGRARAEVFRGEYRLEAEHRGRRASGEARVGRGGSEAVLVLRELL